MNFCLRSLCAPAFVILFSIAAMAGDWPQVLGQNRNGIAVDEKLPTEFPTNWPKQEWSVSVGSGFAGVAVAGGQVFVFHRKGDSEIIQCLNAANGNEVWSNDFPTNYRPSIVADDGPLCVPTVTKHNVIVYGASGGLRCLNRKTGKSIWQVETHQKYGASTGYFGAGSCPIVVDDNVLVNVGGARQQAGIVAFRLTDGKEAWKATSEQPSYSSPILTTLGKTKAVLFITRLNFIIIDPETGNELARLPFGQRGPTVNGASPVMFDKEHVFLSASYGVGAIYARLTSKAITPVWSNDNTLSSQYTTSIVRQGKLYGIDGRQDQGVAALVCIDPKSQQTMWRKEGFGYATLILAGSKLLAMKTDGELVVADANPNEYKEFKRVRLSRSTTRALPALSNGQFFVRDESKLYCYGVGSASSE